MHEKFMAEALKEANKAYKIDEVPIGCVIVCDDKIVSRSHNKKITNNNSTSHAELIAINKAQKVKNIKYLEDCTLYVTIEPCAMCAGAMINSRLGKLVFGAREPKTGCCVSVYPLLTENKFNHKVDVVEGILSTECTEIMQKFFKEKRMNKC